MDTDTTTSKHLFITDDIRIARRLWRFMTWGWASSKGIVPGSRAGQESHTTEVSAPLCPLAAACIVDQVAGGSSVVWQATEHVTLLMRRNGRLAKRLAPATAPQ